MHVFKIHKQYFKITFIFCRQKMKCTQAGGMICIKLWSRYCKMLTLIQCLFKISPFILLLPTLYTSNLVLVLTFLVSWQCLCRHSSQLTLPKNLNMFIKICVIQILRLPVPTIVEKLSIFIEA